MASIRFLKDSQFNLTSPDFKNQSFTKLNFNQFLPGHDGSPISQFSFPRRPVLFGNIVFDKYFRGFDNNFSQPESTQREEGFDN